MRDIFFKWISYQLFLTFSHLCDQIQTCALVPLHPETLKRLKYPLGSDSSPRTPHRCVFSIIWLLAICVDESAQFFFWKANFHILRWIQNSREPLQQLQGTLLTFFFKCFKPISCAQDGVVSRENMLSGSSDGKIGEVFHTSMLKTCLSVTSWSMQWHLIAECVRVIFLFFFRLLFDFYSKAFHLQVLI